MFFLAENLMGKMNKKLEIKPDKFHRFFLISIPETQTLNTYNSNFFVSKTVFFE